MRQATKKTINQEIKHPNEKEKYHHENKDNENENDIHSKEEKRESKKISVVTALNALHGSEQYCY